MRLCVVGGRHAQVPTPKFPEGSLRLAVAVSLGRRRLQLAVPGGEGVHEPPVPGVVDGGQQRGEPVLLDGTEPNKSARSGALPEGAVYW
jgi:hypothetical protein